MPQNYAPIQVGKRYVFFSSLDKSENSSLRALGRHAAHTLSNIDNQLTGQTDANLKQQDTINYIQQYLNFLQKTADHMKNNEVAFVSQQVRQLEQMRAEMPNKNLDELLNLLNDLNDSEKFDYMKFITLMNALMIEPSKRRDIIGTQLNNIELLATNFENMTEEEQQNAREAYIENYDAYKKNFSKNLLQSLNDNKTVYLPSITNLAAEKITAVISSLSNNPILLNTCAAQIKTNTKITNKMLLSAIISIIVDEVLADPKRTTEELINSITQKVTTDTSTIINNFLEHNSFEVFNSKKQRELEQLAMRKENEFTELASAVLNLQDHEIRTLFQEYDKNDKYELKKLYDNLKKALKNDSLNSINNKKGLFTRALGQAIQDKLTASVRQEYNNPNLSFNEIKEIITKQSEKYYQKRELRKELQTQLKVTQIKHSGVAELLGTQEVQNQLVNAIFSRTPGTTINLKDDINFMISFVPKDSKIPIKMDKVNKKIAQEYKNYLPEYHEIAKGLTDIEASQKTYKKKILNATKEIKKQLELSNKDTSKIEQTLNNFYDAFLGSISVKDYDLYNNELGFHGGSLGGKGASNVVIENITRMYELGGLSAIDTDTLIFAVINATDSTYGTSNLRQHIANYLLGGAALMMFDEGFTSTKDFLQKTESELFHLKNVQLYRLNNIYLPASYILYTIYDQLQPIYNDIVTNFSAATKTNQVIITPHALTENDIPTGSDYPYPIDRWNSIATQAMKDTKIQFLFMAGILDIFENLANAFNVKLQ